MRRSQRAGGRFRTWRKPDSPDAAWNLDFCVLYGARCFQYPA